MNGKSKCKILKEIRQRIAAENNIEFITSECKFQGNCTGTCPKCEAEVRYLEEELRKRQRAGKAVAVAGIAAALLVGAVGCAASATPTPQETTSSNTASSSALLDDDEITAGVPTESTSDEILTGIPELPPDALMGEDVPDMGDIVDDTFDMGEVTEE